MMNYQTPKPAQTRDEIAALCMAAMLGNSHQQLVSMTLDATAETAVGAADALLKALGKHPAPPVTTDDALEQLLDACSYALQYTHKWMPQETAKSVGRRLQTAVNYAVKQRKDRSP